MYILNGVLFLSTLFLNCPLLGTQNRVKWKVVDAVTNENMPYVSISVLTNTFKSTISNTNGEFSIDNLVDTDTIVFSYLGYELQSITGNKLFNKTEILLVPQIFELPEVVIRNINIKEFMRVSFDNIRSNYPSNYPVMEGLYRKQITENKRCVFIGESNLAIKSVNLKELLKRKKSEVFFYDIKTSENLQTDSSVNFNFINDPAMYPVFTELRPENFDNYNWEILNIYESDDSEQRIFKIKFTGKKSMEDSLMVYNNGIVFISEKDKAILAARIVRKFNNQITDEGVATENYLTWDAYYKKNESYYQYFYMRAEWTFKYFSNEKKTIYDYNITADYLTQPHLLSNKHNRKFKKSIFDPFKNPKNATIYPFSKLNKITLDYEFKY
jgi:hypothetical protein